MNRYSVIQTLRAHEPELRAAGIVHLRVFGSVARDEATADSDVDLMADFDRSKRFTLLTISSLQRRLSDLLGVEVDLGAAGWMQETIRTKALNEAIRVF